MAPDLYDTCIRIISTKVIKNGTEMSGVYIGYVVISICPIKQTIIGGCLFSGCPTLSGSHQQLHMQDSLQTNQDGTHSDNHKFQFPTVR
jgi:hypothetical protein